MIALYLRILQTPLEQLAQYHNKFKTFVNSRPLSELLLPNEVIELETEKKKQEEKYNELTSKKEEGETIDPAEITAAGIKTGDEVEVEFRAKVMANREELFKKVTPCSFSPFLLFPFAFSFPAHTLFRHWRTSRNGARSSW